MKFVLNAIFVLTLISSVSFRADARGGDEILNGGGVAEQNFTLAWLRLPTIFEYCAKVNCAQTSGGSVLLAKLQNLAQPFPSLNFASRKEKPGNFQIEGWATVIAGGGTIGSTFTVDTDALYFQGLPMAIDEASRQLVLALLGRAGQPNQRPDAEKLAARLGRLAVERVQARDLASIGQPAVRILVWSFSSYSSEVAIGDSENQTSLTETIQTNLICPDAGSASPGFFLRELVWEEIPDWDSQTHSQPLQISGEIAYRCSSLNLKARIDILPSFAPLTDRGARVDRPDWRAIPGIKLRYLEGSAQVSVSDVSVEGKMK